MATDVELLSSAFVSPSDKSGQSAAQRPPGGTQAAKEEQETSPAPCRQGDIEKQVQDLQAFGQQQGWTVSFGVEEVLDRVVIKVMDASTGVLIRQLPSEELIALNKRIQALRQGEAGANPRVGLLLDSEI